MIIWAVRWYSLEHGLGCALADVDVSRRRVPHDVVVELGIQ